MPHTRERGDIAYTMIPSFSLTELKEGMHQDTFRKCLTQIGAFYLENSGISDADHEPARITGLRFFEHSNSAEQKAATSPIPTARRGFSRLESESTALLL